MRRSRMISATLGTLACVAFVAGCGGGGYTAAENAPATSATTTAPAASTTPAAPSATTAVGVYQASDPTSEVATFAGYQRFPANRAERIFIDPTVKPVAPVATAAIGTTTTTSGTSGSTGSAGSASGATASPPKASTTELVAVIDVSGTSETVKVGSAVPASSPKFTVQGMSLSAVTLKVNSGTLPGGGQTIDIKVNESVTLSNPSDGSNYVIKVMQISQQSTSA